MRYVFLVQISKTLQYLTSVFSCHLQKDKSRNYNKPFKKYCKTHNFITNMYCGIKEQAYRFCESTIVSEFVFYRSSGHILHENAQHLKMAKLKYRMFPMIIVCFKWSSNLHKLSLKLSIIRQRKSNSNNHYPYINPQIYNMHQTITGER